MAVKKNEIEQQPIKAGKEEVLVKNPTGQIRSVNLAHAKELLRNKMSGFTLVDGGDYAKELEDFLNKLRK